MTDFQDDFNADLDPEIMAELGDEVIFTPLNGSAVTIKGEFNDKFYLTDAETGVESFVPAIECLQNEVNNAKNGTIERKGVIYNVKQEQPDGTGMVLLILRID